MNASYVALSFNSLPKVIKEAIESGVERSELIKMMDRPRYGQGVKRAALHHLNKRTQIFVSQ